MQGTKKTKAVPPAVAIDRLRDLRMKALRDPSALTLAELDELSHLVVRVLNAKPLAFSTS